MYTEKEFELINKLAAEMKDDCVKFIQDLIRIPSISGTEKGVADRIIEELNKLGYDKVMRDKYGNDFVQKEWTKEDQDELRENCDWEWTTYNGVAGMKVKSKKNEAFIFLPAAGYRSGSSTSYAAEYGYYQSASLDLKNSDDSYYFYFNSGGHYWQDFSTTVGRDVGFSVRPVMSPNGKPDNDVGGSPGNGDGTSGGSDPTHDEYDDF